MRWRHPILAAAILAAIPLATIAGLSLAHAAARRSTSPAPITLPYSPKIDPANFAAAVDNRYFPLKPGTTLRYRGVAENGKSVELARTFGSHLVAHLPDAFRQLVDEERHFPIAQLLVNPTLPLGKSTA